LGKKKQTNKQKTSSLPPWKVRYNLLEKKKEEQVYIAVSLHGRDSGKESAFSSFLTSENEKKKEQTSLHEGQTL